MQLCEMCDIGVQVPVRVSVLCYCLKFSIWPKGLLNTKLSLFHKMDDKSFLTKMNPSMLFFLSLRSWAQVSGGFQQTWKYSQRLPIFLEQGLLNWSFYQGHLRSYICPLGLRRCAGETLLPEPSFLSFLTM